MAPRSIYIRVFIRAATGFHGCAGEGLLPSVLCGVFAIDNRRRLIQPFGAAGTGVSSTRPGLTINRLNRESTHG